MTKKYDISRRLHITLEIQLGVKFRCGMYNGHLCCITAINIMNTDQDEDVPHI